MYNTTLFTLPIKCVYLITTDYQQISKYIAQMPQAFVQIVIKLLLKKNNIMIVNNDIRNVHPL